MKIETGPDLELTKAIFLRSKCYIYTTPSEETNKQKGVQNSNKFMFDEYFNCLENNQNYYATNYSLKSKKHEITMIKQDKIALSSFDDKRCYINTYESVPYGYLS